MFSQFYTKSSAALKQFTTSPKTCFSREKFEKKKDLGTRSTNDLPFTMGNCLQTQKRLERNSDMLLTKSCKYNGSPKKSELEKRHLIGIVPVEVWRQVFENLDHPVDLEHVSNASLFFRDVLLPQRVHFLFPQVWQILDIKYHQSGPSRYYISEENEISASFEKLNQICDSCKRWTAKWWRISSLELRGVCGTWRSAIDTFLQDLPNDYKSMGQPGELITCTSRYFQTMIIERRWKSNKRLLRRLLKIHPPNQGRNPFINRAIELVLNTNGRDQIRNEIFELLKIYGHHIWYCNITIGCRYLAYLKFRGLLELMPNLKALKIQHPKPYNPAYEEYEELEKWIKLYPMPKFVDLQVLVLVALPSFINIEATRSNNHVQVLKVIPGPEDEEVVEFANTLFPHMRELSMNFIVDMDFFWIQEAEHMQMPELRKLYFGFEFCNFMSWADIFSVLEKRWADTLTSLELKLPYGWTTSEQNGIIEGSPFLKLRLPQVKYLKLVIPNLTSLDFLLPMKDSLEVLDVTMIYEEADEEKKNMVVLALGSRQVLKLLSCSNRLLESNIWRVFPELKLLRFAEKYGCCRSRIFFSELKPKVHTRKEWEMVAGEN